MKKNTRLTIEISDELQKKIKNYSTNNNLSIKDFITNLIENEIYNRKNKIHSNDNSKFKIAVLCGGPSAERGISLNSTRSVLDHLSCDNIEIIPFFIDTTKKAYLISKSQLYSNTPNDFDFKLKQTSTPLTNDQFINELKKVDIVFPIIHGKYGEDGEIQSILEQNNIPFVGSTSSSCKKAFNKEIAQEIILKNGFYAFPSLVINNLSDESKNKIKRFFILNKLNKAIVKPSLGGSSIGVSCVYSYEETYEKIEKLIKNGYENVIIEPFCNGREFTIIVLQNKYTHKPVALIPSEIEMKYENYQIFDYRRKYLPTEQTRYHTPARFENESITKIRKYVEELFTLFDLKDIARIDGWLLNDGRIWFSDINIASGMEQNSFVFQQSSRIGLSHFELLKYVIESACNRQNIKLPIIEKKFKNRKKVNVLMGGKNAERQVSLMSGTNIWLKLSNSEKYSPTPYLIDKNDNVWYLPYMYNLSHTVEEIYNNCIFAEQNTKKLMNFIPIITKELEIKNFIPELPIKYSFEEFLKLSQKEDAFVFIALHGGMGEDGTIQKYLDKYNLKYNGSPSDASKLGMNKYETGKVVENIKNKNIITAPKIKFSLKNFDKFELKDYDKFWTDTIKKLKVDKFIVKPACDGSSAGAIRIYNSEELKTYIDLLKNNSPYIPANTFRNQKSIIEMPSNINQEFLLESFIETDKIIIQNEKLNHIFKTGWLELTVGVIEKNNKYHSFNPSITVAENDVLTIEEKFQGGTGINITPPPESIISKNQLEKIKSYIEIFSKAMKIKNYSRIDIFFNIKTDKMIVIEANTLPALTPSTVIYHQALMENPVIYPIDFLELIIDMKIS